jgi:hypothetical protein
MNELQKFRQITKLLAAMSFNLTLFALLDSLDLITLKETYYKLYELVDLERVFKLGFQCCKCRETMNSRINGELIIKINGKDVKIFAFPDIIANDPDLQSLITEVSPKSTKYVYDNEIDCSKCGKINYVSYYRLSDPDYISKLPALLSELSEMVAREVAKTRSTTRYFPYVGNS